MAHTSHACTGVRAGLAEDARTVGDVGCGVGAGVGTGIGVGTAAGVGVGAGVPAGGGVQLSQSKSPHTAA